MTLGESIFLEGQRIRVDVMSFFGAQDAPWIFLALSEFDHGRV
jgi:hypothetical protein